MRDVESKSCCDCVHYVSTVSPVVGVCVRHAWCVRPQHGRDSRRPWWLRPGITTVLAVRPACKYFSPSVDGIRDVDE